MQISLLFLFSRFVKISAEGKPLLVQLDNILILNTDQTLILQPFSMGVSSLLTAHRIKNNAPKQLHIQTYIYPQTTKIVRYYCASYIVSRKTRFGGHNYFTSSGTF